MQIDDNFRTIIIKENGTFSVPNANAVAFSLVPITGKFPVKVVVDKDDKNPITVDSPRYLGDGVPFTLLEIKDAQPHSTFALRLLTDVKAQDLGRTLHSAAGNLVTEPAGAIPLFDIDTSTTRGIVAWRELAEMALERPSGQEQRFRVPSTAPSSFERVHLRPPPPHPYYEEIVPAEPTWNVSAGHEVVYGLEMWGNAIDDSGEREYLPAFGLFQPFMHLVDAENGAETNDPLFMGPVGDFSPNAPGAGTTIPTWGLTGRIFTGAKTDSQVAMVTRTTQRAYFARFELKLQRGTLSLSDFVNQRRFIRLFAYAVV